MKRFIILAAFAAVMLSVRPDLHAQTATSLFWRADSLQRKEIVSAQAVQYGFVGHHGPAVENSAYALRLLFNDSGAIGVYSKSGERMELLRYLWYPTEEQRAGEGAGCDEYRVGRTLGLGGIALWDGEKEVKLVATNGRTARVGSIRGGSFAEIVAYGVMYRGEAVDVSIRVEMKDKSRVARVIATELGGRKVQFLTGINYYPGETVGSGRKSLWVWGTHPSDASRTPTEIGAGMWFRPRDFEGEPEKTDRMLRLVSKPASRLETEITAASSLEDELDTAEKFAAYMSK